MQRSLVVLSLVVLVLGGCVEPPRGGVTPYPPGPRDALKIIFGQDYSGLCPEHYDYCNAGKGSICCPRGGCCDDGNGPYCCEIPGYYPDDRDRHDHDDDRYDRQPDYDRDDRSAPGGGGPCGGRATTCSRGGVTICCAEHEGCCSDSQGLYCCSSRGGGGY